MCVHYSENGLQGGAMFIQCLQHTLLNVLYSENRRERFLQKYLQNFAIITQQTERCISGNVQIKGSALPQSCDFLGRDPGTSLGSPASHQWCWAQAEVEELSRVDPGEELARLHWPSRTNRSVL